MYLIKLPEGIDNRYYGAHFLKRLEIGNFYEDLVVAELRSLKLDAYRPNQKKLPKTDRMTARHQTDILVKTSKTKRLTVEVKSRASVWGYPSILVGSCDSWDLKRRTVGAVIVCCQNTGDTRVAPGNIEEFLRMKVGGNKLSYSIPTKLFCPLDVWADSILDGLYNQ